MPHSLDEQPFRYTTSKAGLVMIHARGKIVTTLRGKDAARFLKRVEAADDHEAQRLMARATGQFKFGNERPLGKPGA